jgi:lipoate-protein ligase A
MLHHGTLLFNSDLNFIGQALTVKADKIESKGVKSVRSRITNISEYMQKTISMVQFRNQLMTSIIKKNNASPLRLSQENLNAIEQLCETKYSSWEWNYGTAPRYEIQKHRRFPSGGVTVSMSISRQGAIDNISIRGDFFGIEDISQLEKLLTGKTMKETALLEVLSYCNISDYISGITAREFADILLY